MYTHVDQYTLQVHIHIVHCSFLGNNKNNINFILYIVPSGFPQNLIAITINSTAITVSWEEVLVNETNGIITQYNVIGVPDESFADTVNETVDSSTVSIVFGNLEEFVVYRFTVRARTAIGFGPTSPVVSAQTAEAGTTIIISTFILQ